MIRFSHILLAAGLLVGCGSRYSADEYASRAVQQANPVQQGIIAGSRRVAIAAGGEAGAAAGGAAGGVIGSAAAAGNSVSGALGAVGGALLGGLVGTAAERASANTDAVEYIIRKTDGDLISITQRDLIPIPLGTSVLVITGNQARVVPDYIATQAPASSRTAGRRPGPASPAPARVEEVPAVVAQPPAVTMPPAPSLAPSAVPPVDADPLSAGLPPIAGQQPGAADPAL